MSVDNSFVEKGSESDSNMKAYEFFVSGGFTLFTTFLSKATPIRILRDTGVFQYLLLVDTLPVSVYTSFKSMLWFKVQNFVSVSLNKIYIESDLVTGTVTVGVGSSLSVKSIHVFLGNDLAGYNVII